MKHVIAQLEANLQNKQDCLKGALQQFEKEQKMLEMTQKKIDEYRESIKEFEEVITKLKSE